MARLPGGFRSEDHGEMENFSTLPKGEYLMTIVESDYKENSKGTGNNVVLVREITVGKYKGRKFFRNLAIDNPNPTTVEIANKELNSTAIAVGKPNFEDTEELHRIPHIVSLYVKGDENRISEIREWDGKEEVDGGTAGKDGQKKPSGVRRPVVEEDVEEVEKEEKKPLVKRQSVVIDDDDD